MTRLHAGPEERGQLALFDEHGQPVPPPVPEETTTHFDGETYEPKLDQQRLAGQLGRVKAIMSDGEWHTIAGIAGTCQERFGEQDSEAGISARLRDLRKKRNGGHTVERKRGITPGLFFYRLLLDQNATT